MSDLQHERIVALAAELRLGALGAFYSSIAQAAAKRADVSYADFLEEVLRAERDARRVRSREMLTRTAGFPAFKTLEAFDFAFATGAPRQQAFKPFSRISRAVRRRPTLKPSSCNARVMRGLP